MVRRYAAIGVVVIAALLVWMGTGRFGEEGPADRPSASDLGKPNVILLVLDAFRADRIDAERNGTPVTPTLNRFAKASLYFTGAVTPCTWTKPAMASILTSLYVDTHQVYYSVDAAIPDRPTGDVLPASLETMATYLKKAGYSTAVIQTNGNLTEELGFRQGFDQYSFQSDADADWVTGLAIEQIGKLTPPFFLYAHYMDPHAPYAPPERYRNVFGSLPSLSAAEQEAVAHCLDYLIDQVEHVLGVRETRQWPELSPEGRETLRAYYDAECRFMDDELAKLFRFVEKKRENTLFIVVADHGEEFWEHGSMGHGQTMYQEQLAVPFFIHGPGIEASAFAGRVETLRILPTVAAYLGLEPNPDWQGRNLLAHLGSNETAPVFSNTHGPSPRTNIYTEMVLERDTKLIANYTAGRIELYDLSTDPRETNNLADRRPETAALLRSLLGHRKANVRHRGDRGLPESTDLPPLLVDQLRALGYLGDGRSVRERVELDRETQERLRGIGYLP